MADNTAPPPTTPAIDPHTAYSLGRAAKLTGVSRDVLRDRCEKKILPCIRPTGVSHPHRRILGADLIAFLRASGVTTPPVKTVTTATTPTPAPPALPSAAVRRRAKAAHQRALEEIGCG